MAGLEVFTQGLDEIGLQWQVKGALVLVAMDLAPTASGFGV